MRPAGLPLASVAKPICRGSVSIRGSEHPCAGWRHDAATRAGDARYERACNDLCLANIVLLNGDADESYKLQARADQAFQELDVINLPRFPWTR